MQQFVTTATPAHLAAVRRSALQKYTGRQLRLMFALHHWQRPMTFNTNAIRLGCDLEAVLRNFFRSVRALARPRQQQAAVVTRWQVRPQGLCTTLPPPFPSACQVTPKARRLAGRCALRLWHKAKPLLVLKQWLAKHARTGDCHRSPLASASRCHGWWASCWQLSTTRQLPRKHRGLQ